MKLDRDDLDTALHGKQMVLVALGAVDELMKGRYRPEFFQMPAPNSEMLCFSIYDLHKRVAELNCALTKKTKQEHSVTKWSL